jgi:cytochrome P450
MMNLFAEEVRRDPYALFSKMRTESPLVRIPPPFDAWAVFDYDNVKRVLNDAETFSSRVPAPRWFIFFDAPEHTRQRSLISRAFTPKMIVALEPMIAKFAGELLGACETGAQRGEEIDLAAEFSGPLPMKVIASIFGIPISDWELYTSWSDTILTLSHTRGGDERAQQALNDYGLVTIAMSQYLGKMIEQRRAKPQDDLLTRLIEAKLEAEIDGEKLSHEDILGFFQLLLVAGQETTSDLLNNAVLSFCENPEQFALLRARPELIGSAIEEVLRYRSPFAWIMRTPRHDVEMHGQTIPKGALVLAMLGSANRDASKFAEPDRFDITRDPNPHVAFGHGVHFCLGAALSRLEARVALPMLFERFPHFELASEKPWNPRPALHVHGPANLPIRIARKAAV